MNNIITIVIVIIVIIIIIIIIVIEMPSNYWFFICSMYISIRHMYTLTHTLLIIFSELYLLSVLIL